MAVYKKHKKIQRKVNKAIRNMNKLLKESINNRFYIEQFDRSYYKNSMLYKIRINDSLNKENNEIYYYNIPITSFENYYIKIFNTLNQTITDFIEEIYKKDSKRWSI